MPGAPQHNLNVRTHGWGGSSPSSDGEAIERILEAASGVIDADDGEFNVAKVARTLGISRQTIYNYFPGSGSLLETVAILTALRFSNRITEHLSGLTDPAEALLEALAFTLDAMIEQKTVRLLFTLDRFRASKRITSIEAVQFTRDLLRRTDVDWAAFGLGDAELEDLGEYTLRVVEQFMLDPGPAKRGEELRAYLKRWVAPVFRSEVEAHRPA
jgi:AcrR family transcriptional regulator